MIPALRRGRVVRVEERGAVTRVGVEVDGELRAAISYGDVEEGDDVVVNTCAADLSLGSLEGDIVHVNLTRGLGLPPKAGAHVMKLGYTSLQHPVHPVEERAPDPVTGPLESPVAVLALHAQLPCVAWQAGQVRPGAAIGFVQTQGGALPGELSRTVAALRERGLLAGHVTAGPAFGGEHEAISVTGALHAGLRALGWDAAIAGPGPGILGSATAYGHGGMAALETAHAALGLGCQTVIVPRMSSGEERERHRGLSHHTRTVLELMLRPAVLALPERGEGPGVGGHLQRVGVADLGGYIESGLPASTMGRGPEQDEAFFRAALAGGGVLGELI